jgi:hypothetical protein
MKTALIILALLVLCAGCASSSDKYESAAHSVLYTSGDYEIRQYESLRLAGTDIASSDRGDRNAGFMRLFGYITGDNQESTEISMTIPVFMSRGESQRMSFVLPAELENAPKANDSKVSISEESLGYVAVHSFSGRAKDAQVADKEAELRAWLKVKGLGGAESWLAVYNQPWTPGPMRHNEVLIRLTDAPEKLAKFAAH